jgi:S-DNA-T family DNA segregation ATPase FtsK/SpoIIIE
LWVLDKPFSEMRMPAWPLLSRGRADMLAPIPFGCTQNLERASVTLFESNWLTGGVPGAGKTSGMLVLGCAAALDPRCELYLVELKGTNDYVGLQPVAHRHVSGAATSEALDATMAVLREVYAQLEKRALALATAIKAGKAPERKVTPELASAGIGLHPLLLILDEIQELFAEKEYVEEAEELLKGILKRGRALAVMVALGTQSPDARSLPKSIERLIGTRYALRVEGQPGNDMILGTSAYQSGHRATLFDETDRGVGLLKVGTNVRTVRSCYLTVAQVEAIGRRARVLREEAGTLTGEAAGQHRQDTDDATRTVVLLDSIEVWKTAGGDDSAWLASLEDALADRWPDRYADLGDGWLGTRLRALKVPKLGQRKRGDGSGGQTNRAGVRRAAILKALEHGE